MGMKQANKWTRNRLTNGQNGTGNCATKIKKITQNTRCK